MLSFLPLNAENIYVKLQSSDLNLLITKFLWPIHRQRVTCSPLWLQVTVARSKDLPPSCRTKHVAHFPCKKGRKYYEFTGHMRSLFLMSWKHQHREYLRLLVWPVSAKSQIRFWKRHLILQGAVINHRTNKNNSAHTLLTGNKTPEKQQEIKCLGN